MELSGALSNIQILRKLEKQRALIATTLDRPERSKSRRRPPNRPESLLGHIVQVLQLAEGPMRTRDIRVAVEQLLGRSVPPGPFKAQLNHHSKHDGSRVERIKWGWYGILSN